MSDQSQVTLLARIYIETARYYYTLDRMWLTKDFPERPAQLRCNCPLQTTELSFTQVAVIKDAPENSIS